MILFLRSSITLSRAARTDTLAVSSTPTAAMPTTSPTRRRARLPVRPAQGSSLAWVLVLALVAGIVWAAGAALHRGHAMPAEQQDTSAGARVTNVVLQAAGADVDMLKDLSGRLEGACARNKYGLSEEACLARLHAREDLCATGTAQRFPGAIADTGRMQAVIKAYVGCIFED
jgi:hypothetical protein